MTIDARAHPTRDCDASRERPEAARGITVVTLETSIRSDELLLNRRADEWPLRLGERL